MNQSAADVGKKLRRAAEKGRLEEVRALMASGAPVTTKDSVGKEKRIFRILRTSFKLVYELTYRTASPLCIKLRARGIRE